MAGYNLTRSIEDLLERTKSSPPSFTVNLHPEYWTLNSGPKFLYNNQIASLLDDIRAHRIPVDFLEFFDAARVPFYDGCMIVELKDFRPHKRKEKIVGRPERTRVVLQPNPETQWSDICLLNQKWGNTWSDKVALEVEARILLATAPPLCLDPDPHLTRMANHVLRISAPTAPASLKRKAAAVDPENDEIDKDRRLKIMQFMNTRPNRSGTPSYHLLDHILKWREVQRKQREAAQNTSQPAQPVQPVQPVQQVPPVPPVPPIQPVQAIQPPQVSSQPSLPPPQPTPVPTTPQTAPSTSDDPKKRLKQRKKGDSSQSPYSDRTASTPTPAPQPQLPPQLQPQQQPPPAQPAHPPQINQFHQQPHQLPHATPPAVSQSPMQAHVYPNVQSATDAAKRVASPAQAGFSQSPQVPHHHPQQHPHLQHPPQMATIPTYQPQMHYLSQPAQAMRNGQPKNVSNGPQTARHTPSLPNTPSHTTAQAQAQAMMQAAYLHRMTPAQPHPGSAAQQQNVALQRSPMIPQGVVQQHQQQQTPNQQQRSSPLATNHVPSRSPVHPNTVPTPIAQLTHQQQYMNAAQQHQYSQAQAAHLARLAQAAHAQAAAQAHRNGSPRPPPHLTQANMNAAGIVQQQSAATAAASAMTTQAKPVAQQQGVGQTMNHSDQHAAAAAAAAAAQGMGMMAQYPHLFPYGQHLGMNMNMGYSMQAAAARLPPGHTYAWPGTVGVNAGRGMPPGVGVNMGQGVNIPGMTPGPQQQHPQQHAGKVQGGIQGR